MMDTWVISSLTLVVIPVLGGLLGLALDRWPRMLKAWVLVFLAATGLALTAYSGSSSSDPTSGILMVLMVLTAFLTALGHNHQQKDTSAVLSLTLIFVGLGLGFMTNEGGTKVFYLAGIFILVGLALFYFRILPREMYGRTLGFYGIGLLCLIISTVAPGPIAALLLFVALLGVFPVFPFHGGFVATLSYLPGSLPAFLVVLLPSLGFFGVVSIIHNLPAWLMHSMGVLALLSALYGALKALVQFRLGHLLAYTYLVQVGIIWWYVAINAATAPHVVLYFSAVTLVASGLYLASHHLESRFGHLDIEKMGGVALSMPRFATIFVVLITAATGLPLFAVFSGFFEMMLHVSPAFPLSALVILTIWLMMSWYYPQLMHRILFGQSVVPTPPHRDLRPSELLSLVLMVLVLVLAGWVPFDLGGFTNLPIQSFHLEEAGRWKL